jgi:hypothetical protein
MAIGSTRVWAFVWQAGGFLLAVVAVRIWDLLLLKRVVHDSPRLLIWIAVAWALAVLCAAAERRGGDRLPRLFRRIPSDAWIVAALFSVLLLLLNVGYQRAASDGSAYFAQLHSIFFDGDLDFTNDIDAFGGPALSFPIGTALLWSPFYVAAHLWLGVLNLLGEEHVRDGFNNPYQRAVGLGTLLYGAVAVLMIAQLTRRHFDRATALTAVFVIVLATPVVWYVAVDASMSHGVSLFAATLFLYLWAETRSKRRFSDWAALGLSGALMLLVRPQNALFLAVFAVEAVTQLWSAWRSGDQARLLRLIRAGAAAALAAIALATGALMLGGIDSSYLLSQHVGSQWTVGLQLFSPHHGLFSSSPVLVFAVLGLPLLFRRDPQLAAGLSLALVLQVVVSGTSPGWNGGASFGARRFVSCAPVFVLGLAAAVQAARRRPMIPVVAGLGGLVVMNLALADDVRRQALNLSEPVPFDRMVSAVTQRVGNPFVLPGAFLFTRRHQIPLEMYDRIPARRYQRLPLDIGSGDDDPYLIGSWFAGERAPDGSFRWAAGPEVGIFTQARARRYLVRFEAQPFSWPSAPPQTVHVYLGQQKLGDFVMDVGLRSYEIEIPAELMPSDGWIRLSFRFAYSQSPRDVIDSEDTRPLAARFRSITLEPF